MVINSTALNISFTDSLYYDLQVVKDSANKYNMSPCIAIVGIERGGKSTLASHIALEIDPTIKGDVDRVAFNIRQFKESCEKARELGKGKVVVLDEAGNIFSADDSKKKTAIQLKKIVQMNGKYNIVYILVLPSIFDLTNYMRIHRINWFLKVKIKVYEGADHRYILEKGRYDAYSYDQKIRLLMMARYKYDYSQAKPLYYGNFTKTPSPTEIYGEAYETKKDAAIQELYKDEEINEKYLILQKLHGYLNQKVTVPLICQTMNISDKTMYNWLKKAKDQT